MAPNVLVFAWNRSLPGRETLSAQHFGEFLEYLAGEQRKGQVESFEPVLLDAHGGSVNGWVLIRGEPGKLNELAGSREWIQHVTRALLHLDGASVLRGVTGPALMERMDMWTRAIPGKD
jgi:hypothetical protein